MHRKSTMKMGSLKSTISAIVLFLSIFLTLSFAFAASGGRMGGDAFSDRSPSPPSREDDHYHDHYYHHHHHHRDNWRSSSSNRNENEQRSEGSKSNDLLGFIIPAGMVGAFSLVVFVGYMNNRASIMMIQVGLTGNARSLKKELNEIAKTADSSSAKGWQLILTETVTALLRHPQYYISGYSSVKQHWNVESVEKSFRELSNEERGKIDLESLVNVNNVKRRRTVIPEASKIGKDYIVVTILVAAKGSYKVPLVKSIDDLKDALRSLSISSSNLQAVEVLWTPQDEDDTLSADELVECYPLLRPI
ncbi:FLUCTUATING-LIGHT-ACCLIMATION protein 1, chloroplastic-like [Euphorbia lathyris]|uniref:FLUCTUATING-LIGHT-ACCLIMATION protein 1, chloroplastic-like n=1 Tax=Euphorbia lathyris TaxID=212925 RepID=UPI0033141172